MGEMDGKTINAIAYSKPKVSVVIVTYNSINFIDHCLESVMSSEPFEVIVVDNSSMDKTVERIVENFPKVKIVQNDTNLGYGRAVNKGTALVNGDVLVILNPDTTVEKEWLDYLVFPLIKEEKTIAVPRIMVYDGSVINTCGNLDHFTGLSFTNGFGRRSEEMINELSVSGISGACFALRKDDFLDLGGFDEDIFLYMEDTELSWRAHSKGYSFVYVPESIVNHEYKLNVSAEKLFRLEDGRYYLLRKFLTIKDMISIGPSLIMTELLSWGYALRLGAKGMAYKAKTMRRLFSNPRSVQQVEYKVFLMKFDTKIPMDQLSYGFLDEMVKRWANAVYSVNYRILTK